ncbi:FMN-binding protein [uncultured Fusobacterium sp.]|uniref:FMN-binding protein n=1 Tax=uncultured Fusobacterium sp. TaxID=159267 RepID=UPI00260AD629|nr:FMN-binding protein [uncultured Fusobacterium sp.]
MKKKLLYSISILAFAFSTVYGATVEGSGDGYKGEIKVKVTYKGNKITNIEVIEHEESNFTKKAMKKIIQEIISKQSTDVDVVSGATYTSEGLKEAVNEAIATAGITLEK